MDERARIMTVMRKPVDMNEAAQMWDAWKVVFKAALTAHINVTHEDVVEHAAAMHLFVRNAAITADVALEKLIERGDEFRASVDG